MLHSVNTKRTKPIYVYKKSLTEVKYQDGKRKDGMHGIRGLRWMNTIE